MHKITQQLVRLVAVTFVFSGVINLYAAEPIRVTASNHDGNIPENTLDSDFNTRWSANNNGQWIEYDFGKRVNLNAIDIAFYKGDQRAAFFTLEGSDNKAQWMTLYNGASNGISTDFERFNLEQANYRYFRYVGSGNTLNTWNSLTAMSFISADIPEIPKGISVRASSDDGNVANNVLDSDMGTRWSANGDGQWLEIRLPEVQLIGGLEIAFFKGDERTADFELMISVDGINWQDALPRTSSSGNSQALQPFLIPASEVQFIRFIGYGNSKNSWNSLLEVNVLSCKNIDCLPPCETDNSCEPPCERDNSCEPPCELDNSCEPPCEADNSCEPPCELDNSCEEPPCAINDSSCQWWPTPIPLPEIPQAPNASLPPHGNFDLGDWYLSVPTDFDGDKKPDDVKEEFLWSGYQNSQYFYIQQDGGLVMWCPVKGAKTPNTKYSRVELREMLRRGDKQYPTEGVNKNNWVFGSNTSAAINASGGVNGVLNVTLKVDHVTTTGNSSKLGRVVIGQIHATKHEPLRLYYRKMPHNEKGSIYFAHETADGDEDYYELIGEKASNADNPEDGVALGDIFSYEVVVVDDLMTVTISRPNYPDVSETINMKDSGYDEDDQYMFFKVGVYNQNATGDDDDFVQATFYKIENAHDNYLYNQ